MGIRFSAEALPDPPALEPRIGSLSSDDRDSAAVELHRLIDLMAMFDDLPIVTIVEQRFERTEAEQLVEDVANRRYRMATEVFWFASSRRRLRTTVLVETDPPLTGEGSTSKQDPKKVGLRCGAVDA